MKFTYAAVGGEGKETKNWEVGSTHIPSDVTRNVNSFVGSRVKAGVSGFSVISTRAGWIACTAVLGKRSGTGRRYREGGSVATQLLASLGALGLFCGSNP